MYLSIYNLRRFGLWVAHFAGRKQPRPLVLEHPYSIYYTLQLTAFVANTGT